MMCAVRCFWCDTTIALVPHKERVSLYRDYKLCEKCLAKLMDGDNIMVMAVGNTPNGKTAQIIGRRHTLNGDYPTGDYFIVDRKSFLSALKEHNPNFWYKHHADISTMSYFEVSVSLFHEIVDTW